MRETFWLIRSGAVVSVFGSFVRARRVGVVVMVNMCRHRPDRFFMFANMRTPSHPRDDQRKDESDEQQAEHVGTVTRCGLEGNRRMAAPGEQHSSTPGPDLDA